VSRVTSIFGRGAGIAQPAADDVAEPKSRLNPNVRVPYWLDAIVGKTL
jgi:hypothetical protein